VGAADTTSVENSGAKKLLVFLELGFYFVINFITYCCCPGLLSISKSVYHKFAARYEIRGSAHLSQEKPRLL